LAANEVSIKETYSRRKSSLLDTASKTKENSGRRKKF